MKKDYCIHLIEQDRFVHPLSLDEKYLLTKVLDSCKVKYEVYFLVSDC